MYHIMNNQFVYISYYVELITLFQNRLYALYTVGNVRTRASAFKRTAQQKCVCICLMSIYVRTATNNSQRQHMYRMKRGGAS